VINLPSIKSQDTTSHFKTNVLLKSIIGKDLINNDNIAVIELVKNSIDAESPKILIEFKNLKRNNNEFINKNKRSDISKTSKIIISDFGKGMDKEDIEAKWLNIAYSEKKNARRENGLYFAGAKGVGRFSCDRLGEYLDLYSKKKNKPIRHLHIRWKDFEVENEVDLEIQDINILHEEISDEDFYDRTGIKSFKQGTIVEISKLRGKWVKYQPRKKSWDLENLVNLKRYLEKLINPYQNSTANPYTIHILAEEFLDEDKSFHEHEKINGIIENKIFDKLDFKTTSIESQISEDGDEITTILKDKGRIIFRLREKNIKFPLLKNIRIVLFFLNQYAKIYFKKQTGTRSVEFGSIHLFINGFRVPPFGDEGNDWLKLEIRKGQGYARFLGTRDLLGRREGVVNNAEFSDLKEGSGSYFYEVLKKLERYVVEGLNWDRVSRKNLNEDDEFGELTNKEVKKFIKNYEINVMDKDWQLNPEDEIYGETLEEKDLRNIELLYSILNVKPEYILELYINEDLIKVLVAENEEKAKRIFQDLNKINPELINGNTKKVIQEINLLFEVKERELNEKSKKIKEDLLNKKKLTEQLKHAQIEKFRAEQKVKTEVKARKIAEKAVVIDIHAQSSKILMKIKLILKLFLINSKK
jgi:anti-sigma regulatory factor (Ser/Thr protein kinase)